MDWFDQISKYKIVAKYKAGDKVLIRNWGLGTVYKVEDGIVYVEFERHEERLKLTPQGQKDMIRDTLSESEAAELLKSLKPKPTSRFSRRYYMDKLQNGTARDFADILCELVEETSPLAKRMVENAKNLLVEELAFSLKKSKAEVEKVIDRQLNPKHLRVVS